MEIRLEKEEEFREVEEVTREAFWNFYVPGCNEHLILHNMRKSTDFIPELSFVAVKNGKVVGNIVFTHSKIIKDDGGIQPVITFGPLSVLPEFQNQGIGGALIKHSITKAKEMGFKAILIYGYPDYYKRFGFVGGIKFGISRSDGAFPKALQVFELYENSLHNISGKFFESTIFETNPDELEEFDKNFPDKEKKETKSQENFSKMVDAMEDSKPPAIPARNC